jgi:hypothetical protein
MKKTDASRPRRPLRRGVRCEEIGKKSRAHVMEQMQKGDQAHLSAANNMRTAAPEQQQAMMAEFKKKFDQAPQRLSPAVLAGFGR